MFALQARRSGAAFVLFLFLAACSGESSGEEPQDPGAKEAPARAAGADADSGGGAKPGAGGRGIELSLYKEEYQGAFQMLIPKGWKTEGGMIPSGADWNIVDLVESNIKFRVTSPDGRSFFGWYPRFYFQDPAVIAQTSWGNINPTPGQVLNGCWLYPYMPIRDYIQTIVFGQFAAQEFGSPRILGQTRPAPELAPWVPRTAARSEAGYVNFECSVKGTPTFGRIYAIVYELAAGLWTTVGTFGLVAPKDRWPDDERLMEMCIRTFRLDPGWASRAASGAARRGQQLNDVLGEMHRIDAEMQRDRAQTNSDINTEVYKVLTGQIETYDPQSGEEKWLPMYNHAWTDGKGNYFLRDYDDGTLPFENASEWRPLEIVNRNDPDYRPRQ